MRRSPSTHPLAWANRRIELLDGHWAVAGNRLQGRDIEKPFVDVFATSLPPKPADIAAHGEALPHFSALSPLCLRVNFPDPAMGLRTLAASEVDARRNSPDLLIVGRPVSAMLEQPLGSRYHEVPLVPCGPAEAERRVAEIHDELKRAQPQLDQWATPADADTLEDATEEGLLFDIRVNGTSAGVVAAERDDAYGLAGFWMQEIVLDSAHRGSRVGVAALRRLCHEVPSTTDDVLWGHIHPDNVPSLRDAQASGRKIVTAQAWVTPRGYSGMPV